jgi:ABC-type sugar transport system permease subunit
MKENVTSLSAAKGFRFTKFLVKYKESLMAYLFISPFYLLFCIFGLFPVFYTLFLSFQKWNGLGIMEFKGFDNYIMLFTDPQFWNTLINTGFIWAGNVFIVLILAFLMALFVNQKLLRFKSLFRGILYLPQATAVVAIALCFSFILDTHYGILNSFLHLADIPSIPWLTDAFWAKISIILVIIWRVTPWHMLVILAGLQSIDGSMYEAAKIDGATSFQTIRYITVPVLRPIFFYCFIMATIFSFHIFAEPYVITGGGPGDATMTLSLYMYKSAFEFLKLGYAATISFALLILILLISGIQILFFRSEV